MIQEDYVSFETDKLLKEKGFDEKTISFYPPGNIQRPTLQMAMKWLREVHQIHIEIGFNEGYFPVCISTLTNDTIPYIAMQGKTFKYEETCEAAIKYCLENLI